LHFKELRKGLYSKGDKMVSQFLILPHPTLPKLGVMYIQNLRKQLGGVLQIKQALLKV
jgi:hypothetical protein